ncbi:beta-glucoside-specific PTS transporter subunit IIABC [Konateibacter massiliensis]|uniref:beta-glucoside-specific PTS transporter subunit IIABC n=1 Tax=Konateibacter massiliensis TaxID=2002841 RepID=UPI000C151694|nr:beta-glucoside-specific PTS transporter subunit IIABC [Konateibacter massiliensis]
MKYKELASSLLQDVGGKENIEKVIHCATRLRFTLKDEKKAKTKAIKETKGVSGVVQGNGQFQVIIGPDVASVYDELMKLGIQSGDGTEGKKKGKVFDSMLDFIASCFTPVVAVITAGGMLQVLLSILSMAGVLSDTSNTYLVLYQVSQAAFFFMPIYLGYSVANKLKIDPFLGMMLGGVLVLPGMTSLLGQEGGVSLFSFPLQNVTYSASVVPILLGVWFMSYIYKFADKFIPSYLKFILRPLITIAVSAPVLLLLLGPLGTYIGNYIADFLSFLMDGYAPLAVMFMGAFAQLLVMTGMHYCLMPILMATFTAFGYDNLIVPGMLVGIASEAGVCLAVGLKAKDSEWKQLGFSTAITSAMGISEPALYGVTLKLKKPLIAIIISGALGGLYAGITGVKAYALVASFAALPTFMVTMPNFVNACISVAITVVSAFLITWILVKKEDLASKNAKADKKMADANPVEITIGKEAVVNAVTTGDVVALSDVDDQAFSSGALGKGIAIDSTDGIIKAPANAFVTTVFPTKHAMGLTTEEGVEILIHVGIDTVNLNGEGFELFTEENQQVKQGEQILSFDKNLIIEKGYNPIVIVTVTNTDSYLDVIPTAKSAVTPTDGLLTVIK